MSAGDIALVAEEMERALVGLRLRRVDQPSPDSLCLSFSGHRKAWLFASADPALCRIHLANGRVKGDPPRRLGQFLRKHAEGGVVESVGHPPGERVVEIGLAGGGAVKRLVFEMFGRNANIVCLDEGRRILDALRVVRGGRRRIAPGEAYTRPPSGGAGDTSADPAAASVESPSAYFEAAYSAAAKERETERLRAGLAERAGTMRKAAEKAIASADKTLRSADRAEELRRHGELLKINLGNIAHGAGAINVPDVFDPERPPREIRLDPRLSPQGNMQALFRKAGKLERGAKEAVRRRAQAEAEKARAELLAARIAEADAEELGEIEASLGQPRRAAQGRRSGPLSFRSKDGWSILVGRNAEENDRLTFRLAKGNDWWLHVRGEAGSHVVIAAPGGKPPPQDTLVDAATLAAHFSAARGRPSVEVEYTQAKHVRKPRKAPKGTVLVGQGKTLRLRLEKRRLDALLRAESEG